ncbi:predicted protein [Postia placenta Mad-698-R]|nr:predicted protein [Postia placenta Mad-698-R]
MFSRDLNTSMHGNTRDGYDYSVLYTPMVDNAVYPPPYSDNMPHFHQASRDGLAQYVGNGPCSHTSYFEHRVPLVDMREMFLPGVLSPAAAGFEMGAGVSLEGAPEFDLASSNYANATVHLGPVMATSAGLIHHSELDPFPHIDPYILDLIAMESGIGEVNRTSSHDMPSGVSSAPTPGLQVVGQEISYTQQTNGASEDATESGGHTETPLLAESSPAPAYRLAKPRSPAKTKKAKKTPQRPRAPAIKATRPQVASKGPLRCEICRRNKDTRSEYAHQASLNRHIRTAHLDSSRWQCTLCDKSMIRSDALGRHLKKQHHMSDARAKAVVAQVAASKYLTG